MISSFVLISLCSLLIFSTVYRGVEVKNDYSEHYYVNDYLLKQSEALANHTYEDAEYGIYFNPFAHINQAKTIYINNKHLVVTLGNGRIHFE